MSAGGWPVVAINPRPLTLPKNPNADDNGNGYTNLEEWLQLHALGVEQAANFSPTETETQRARLGQATP